MYSLIAPAPRPESLPRVDEASPVAIVCRLTAIILLLRPLEVWWIAPFVLIGAGLSLIFPSAAKRPLLWWSVAALIAIHIVAIWPLSDNHIYLLAYWCLAIGLALASDDPQATLSASGRWLLGAAFAFAVVWKVLLSPDYLDGRFFRVTLIEDDRFADAVMLVSGLRPEDILENRKALEALPAGAVLADPVPPNEPRGFRALVAALTWGGVALEGLVAVAFLSPLPARFEAARHAALLAFCVFTYALAPVAGFGWLIATMGLAQVRPGQGVIRAAYLFVFFLILLYAEVPWAGVLGSWVR